MSSSDCVNTDVTAAEDAYDFFLAFFGAYPELKANPFYLSAESCTHTPACPSLLSTPAGASAPAMAALRGCRPADGGVYIPLFMQQIKRRGGVPNFAGALIGNGCCIIPRSEWHPWRSPLKEGGEPRRAGYAIAYETPTNFSLVTVQGAGHMVPTFKPRFALTMLTKFLAGEAF